MEQDLRKSVSGAGAGSALRHLFTVIQYIKMLAVQPQAEVRYSLRNNLG